MIIKELRIENFAGLENKTISFKEGMNVIYGENERGKSRIESFIKCMLYGISSKRVKGESERVKFKTFNGQAIKGEIIISHKNKTYIIKRTFGRTKKDDSSIILDYLTGEEEKSINRDEPGKFFLGVNKATFEKTLFIEQLGVQVKKDKEEEIMEKITGLMGCAEDEIPAGRALEKLITLRKTITTSRGSGKLDRLKKHYSSLIEERYEGYKIAEKNLQWEQDLLGAKKKRENLRNELEKLQVYKKYLKKIKLQKEYKEITEYLKKSEELKSQEKELSNDLQNGDNKIDDAFIDNLKEENMIYLGLVDNLNELKKQFKDLNENRNTIKEEYEKYKFLELLGDNAKDKVTNLKYEQKSFDDKIRYVNGIKKSKIDDENELKTKKESFKSYEILKEIGKDVADTLKSYEEKLMKLKDMAENNNLKDNLDDNLKNKKTFIFLGVSIGVIGLILMKILSLFTGGAALLLGVCISVVNYIEFNKLNKKIGYEKSIKAVYDEISEIERKLDCFVMKLQVEDYKGLVTSLKKYESFKEYESRMLIRIEEKGKILENESYEDTTKRYNKNNEIIKSLLNVSASKDLEELLNKIDRFEKLKSDFSYIEEKCSEKNNQIKELNKDIAFREKLLREKLSILDLDLANLLDIEVYIKEYKDKLKKSREIHSNLISMEETYKVLLKDRDINAIKDELKDIINSNNEYSYESEEEIEVEEQVKSNELIETEKVIKDIENKINTRLIGKRNLVSIEEEIELTEEKVKKEELYLNAVDIAMENLKESFDELKRDIGPKLNESILENFKYITGDKYGEVLLNDNYDMVIRENNNLFKGNYLSNGAIDQLYLSLRLAFIELLFRNEECPIILDDAFVQYDNKRRELGLLLINNKLKGQGLIFTCHDLEAKFLERNNVKFNLISLSDN